MSSLRSQFDRFFPAICITYLALQVASIVYARFVPYRSFCWAPHDTQDEYWVEATVNGETLTEEEILQRYGIPANGINQHSVHNWFLLIEQYESKHELDERVKVNVRYSINGSAEDYWRYEK